MPINGIMVSQAPAPGSFLEEIVESTPGDSRLGMCNQCGTWGGSCPSAAGMDCACCDSGKSAQQHPLALCVTLRPLCSGHQTADKKAQAA